MYLVVGKGSAVLRIFLVYSQQRNLQGNSAKRVCRVTFVYCTFGQEQQIWRFAFGPSFELDPKVVPGAWALMKSTSLAECLPLNLQNKCNLRSMSTKAQFFRSQSRKRLRKAAMSCSTEPGVGRPTSLPAHPRKTRSHLQGTGFGRESLQTLCRR